MEDPKVLSIKIEQTTLRSDITDFIEENDLKGMLHNAEDLDAIISRLETMRSKYRNLHNQLAELIKEEEYEAKFLEEREHTLSGVKLYIKDAKYIKGIIRNNKLKSNALRLGDVNSTLESLSEEFGKQNLNVTDDELLLRKEELPANLKRFENLSSKMIGIIDKTSITSRADEKAFDKITEKYNQLLRNKEEYFRYMKEELNNRELSKQNVFKESKLNIKLSKFKGYDSELDIYTFQNEFNKIYQRTTPKRMMADLLKNNLLEGPALSLVKSVDEIEEIWRRLKTAYGNSRILLQRKLADINKISLWRIKEPEKLIDNISKITNTMRDMMKLAKTHNIESRLYSGDAPERIYNLIGDQRVTRWLLSNDDEVLEDEELWENFIGFLEKEVRVQQQRIFIQTSTTQQTEVKKDIPSKFRTSNYAAQSVDQCVLCGEIGHVTTNGPNGTKLIQYYSCKLFAELTRNERFLLLQEKELCIQCLYPGAHQSGYKHKDGKCQRDFICKHQSHERFNTRKHVLICQEHSSDDDNKSTLEHYRSRCIKNPNLPEYARSIKLTFHSFNSCSYKTSSQNASKDDDIISEHTVYILQTIKVDEKLFNLFFDTGCNDMVSKHDAVRRIGWRSRQEHPGPIILGGVGNVCTESPHGIFTIKLPLHNGNEATITGVCLDKITAKFPIYPLQGEVENNIRRCFRNEEGDLNELPKLPKSVGGETDFMIGAKYLRYNPKPIFQLPSGLTIYESMFKNADGSRGVVGGPHEVFTRIERSHWSSKEKEMFISQQHQMFNAGYFADLDTSMFNIKNSKDHFRDAIITNIDSKVIARKEKALYEVEDDGNNIKFSRCIDCKHQNSNEIVSLRDEVEQDEINKPVKIDLSNRMTITKLKVFNQQVKNRCPSDLNDVIVSENKLQQLGQVDYVTNLTTEQELMLQNNPIQNSKPDEFPVKKIEETKLSSSDVDVTREEIIIDSASDSSQCVDNEVFMNQNPSQRNTPNEVKVRNKFCNHLIDPNKHKFETVIRIMAYIIRLIQKFKKTSKSTQSNVNLTEPIIEMKKIVNPKKFENISKEKNGVLCQCNSRTLPAQQIQPIGNMTDVMKDLTPTTFCVPIVAKPAPVAYSIVNQVHWHDEIANHTGVETVSRQILKFVFTLEGRKLIKMFRKMCEHSRYLQKKYIDVSMGNVSEYSVAIALPFYSTQFNLIGPFKAFSNQKVRIKYRNHKENTGRISSRSTRSLVLIHPVDEQNLLQ